ncbi:hypothetical protein [Micromonospora sp. NPDC050200]|uniref:hypothetical protein n=1 Tax=Micromonospora sp. NPDC050200 TaxID=3155664 RepID=UPI0033ECA419
MEDAAAWAGVGASVVMSAGALIVSIRSLRESRRAADASERQAAAAEEALTPPPPSVRWQIMPGPGRDSYVLRNVGDAAAVGVEFDTSRTPSLFELDHEQSIFEPGQALTFWAASMAGDDTMSELWLKWGDRPEWTAVPMP